MSSNTDVDIEALWRKYDAFVHIQERDLYPSTFHYLVCGIGYVVGLSNFYVFPIVAFKNGGGAFFLVYTFLAFLIGYPVFLAKCSMAQYSGEGGSKSYRFCHLLRNIWILAWLMEIGIIIYYQIIFAWALWYFISSFQFDLPWATCDNEWSSPLCIDKLNSVNLSSCLGDLIPFRNGTCYNMTSGQLYGIYDKKVAKEYGIKPMQPAIEYLMIMSLRIAKSSGIESIGVPLWDIFVCLVFAWCLTFFCQLSDMKMLSKGVCVTVIFPYVTLIIFVLRGVTLEGSGKGLSLYFYPRLAYIFNMKVWISAMTQCFFSTSVFGNGIHNFAAYQKFRHNVVRDSLIIISIDVLSAFLSGLAVFSVLGNFANRLDVPVKEVVEAGPMLAFGVFPQALALLPAANGWCALYFLFLMTLGLDSCWFTFKSITRCGCELFRVPQKFDVQFKAGFAAVLCLLATCMTAPGGSYIVRFMKHYTVSFNAYIAILLLLLAIVAYGTKRFCRNIEKMAGERPLFNVPWIYMRWFFIVMWTYIIPITLLFLLIHKFITFTPLKLGSYVYPTWVNVFGCILNFLSIACVFVSVARDLSRLKGRRWKKRFKILLRPNLSWGPVEKSAKSSFRGGRKKTRDEMVPTWPDSASDLTSGTTSPTQPTYSSETQRLFSTETFVDTRSTITTTDTETDSFESAMTLDDDFDELEIMPVLKVKQSAPKESKDNSIENETTKLSRKSKERRHRKTKRSTTKRREQADSAAKSKSGSKPKIKSKKKSHEKSGIKSKLKIELDLDRSLEEKKKKRMRDKMRKEHKDKRKADHKNSE